MPNVNLFSNLEIYRTKPFNGLTDENQLQKAMLTAPSQISSMVSYLQGTRDNGSFLDLISGGMGHVKEIESNEYRWKVMIDSDRAIRIIRAAGVNETGVYDDVCTADHYYGHDGGTVTFWLEEDYFGPGAIIELDDRNYQFRVIDAPYQDGTAWVYTTQNCSGNNVDGAPGMYLTSENKVSRLGSAYEDYSDESDIINYNNFIELRNHLTTSRVSFDITGDAYASVLVIAMKDPESGKTSYLWDQWQRWKALKEFHKREEALGIYGKYSVSPSGEVKLKGKNGRQIFIGAGILEQISSANRRSYTTLSQDILESFLSDISYNLLGVKNRHFLCFTGEEGMKQLDTLMKKEAANFALVDTKFITGTGQELTLGGQFKTWNLRNDVSFTVHRMPAFDDREHNRITHPITGKPIESYRMIFIPVYTPDGEANILKVVRKGRELVQWHVGGSLDLGSGFGKSLGTQRSNAKDGATGLLLGESSYMVQFPIACGDLYMLGE